MDVGGYELLGFLGARGEDGGEEGEELVGVVALGEVEVETGVGFADVDGVFVGGVFEDELFEVEEGSFVGDFLADLDDGAPGVGCEGFGAVGTLVGVDDIFNFEGLFEDGTLEGFLLDLYLDFDAPGVRLRPDEAGVGEPYFGKTAELSQAEREKLS